MPHVLPENDSPLNEAAKRWLPQEHAHPYYLHLLNLAAWGLEEGVRGDWSDSHHAAVESQVALMFGWKPANVLAWLRSNPDGPDDPEEQEHSLVWALQQASGPESAARWALNSIYDRLKAEVPALQPAESELPEAVKESAQQEIRRGFGAYTTREAAVDAARGTPTLTVKSLETGKTTTIKPNSPEKPGDDFESMLDDVLDEEFGKKEAASAKDSKLDEFPDDTECWACPTHKAVLQFAATAYAALARKVIFRLQRIDSTDIYGDDYRHKTLWDEYCHEVQNGPHDLLESAWEATLDPILDMIVEAVPRHEAALLTISAVWDLDMQDVGLTSDCVAPDLIRQNLGKAVAKLAGERDMSRFDPCDY